MCFFIHKCKTCSFTSDFVFQRFERINSGKRSAQDEKIIAIGTPLQRQLYKSILKEIVHDGIKPELSKSPIHLNFPQKGRKETRMASLQNSTSYYLLLALKLHILVQNSFSGCPPTTTTIPPTSPHHT